MSEYLLLNSGTPIKQTPMGQSFTEVSSRPFVEGYPLRGVPLYTVSVFQ